MTTIDLDELERLYKAATAGQFSNGAWLAGEDAVYIGPGKILMDDFWEEDAALIVALHNAFPALLAELRAARELIDVLLAAPEWVQIGWRITVCPHCNGANPEDEPYCTFMGYHLGHAPDCPRQRAFEAWDKVKD